MSRRLVLMLMVAAVVLTGCQIGSSPAIKPAPTTPGTNAAPVATGPDPAPPPQGHGRISPCDGPARSPGAVTLSTGDSRIELPLSSCAVSISAGTVTLTLLVASHPAGMPQVTVSGAVGEWDGADYRATLKVEQGRSTTVTFDLKAIGLTEPVAYSIDGGPPAESFLASAPDRKGPWTPVADSGLVPANAAWLRVTYPLLMLPEGPSPVTPDPNALPGHGLPGEWEGDRTQYVALATVPPVLFVRQTADPHGLRLYNVGPAMLYRGDPPELKAVAPLDGATRTLHRFSAVPGFIDLRQEGVRYSTWIAGADVYRRIDLTTGQVSPIAELDFPAYGSLLRFPSPDGKLVAELAFANGAPGPADKTKQTFADLTIREQSTGKTVVTQQRWLSSWGSYGCSNPAPGFDWRPDSTAVAVLDAPAADHLVLKVTDLQGTSRVIAQKQGADAGYEQYRRDVSWSPSGTMIKYGDRVVDAASGRVVSENLSRHGFWSPDSRYLLLSQPNHALTSWGTVRLLEVATGKSQDLGLGLGLGWNAKGEALIVRWDVSRQIPPPGKGCA